MTCDETRSDIIMLRLIKPVARTEKAINKLLAQISIK